MEPNESLPFAQIEARIRDGKFDEVHVLLDGKPIAQLPCTRVSISGAATDWTMLDLQIHVEHRDHTIAARSMRVSGP